MKRRMLGLVMGGLLLGGSAVAQVPQGRLPGDVKPLSYRIDLTVDPAKDRFEGQATINIVTTKPMSALYIHGRNLHVTRAEAVTGRMAPNLATWREADPSGVAELKLARPLAPGRHQLRFSYDAPFETSAQGLHRVKVKDQWYVWSQLEAVEARRVFPSFDEPGFKIPFTVSITAPKALKAFNNAPEVSATPAGAMVKHQFKATQPLPTYLLAFAVGDFDVVSRTIPANAVRKRPLDFRVIATKGQAPRMAFAAEQTGDILARLESYFGIAYPWDKLDIIADPIEGGAMENAGLVVFDDALILLDKDAPPSQIKNFGTVVAHELAHQWFGDLVTPAWWDDIWLNESFADWMGNRIGAEWRPDLGIGVDQISEALGAMDGDSRPANRPIRQTIAKTEEINAVFDGITYQKGGQVIRMFEHFIGDEKFKAGVRLHLNRNRFGTATADQFFQNIGEGSGDSRIAPAWRSFVNQEGVPLITYSPANHGAYALRQERYQPLGVKLNLDRKWILPVCARSGEGTACTLLEDKPAGLQVVGTAPWVAGNADGAGYYRFDLPAQDWDRLIAAAPQLPAPEAVTTVDSLWASFTAGRADFGRVLAGADQFAKHKERLAAISLPFEIYALNGRVLGAEDQPRVAALMRRWFAPKLDQMGLDLRRGAYAKEDPQTTQLRQSLARYVGVIGEDPAVRDKLVGAARAYVGGDAQALDPGFRGVAFSAAVRTLDKSFRDSLYEQAVTSSDPLFRRQALQAFGSVQTADLARETLARLKDERLQNTEFLTMLLQLGGETATRGLMLDWIEANFPTFKKRSGGLLGGVLGVGGSFCTAADVERFDKIFRPRLTEMGASPLDLERPIAAARQCIAFRDAKGAEISAALKAATAG